MLLLLSIILITNSSFAMTLNQSNVFLSPAKSFEINFDCRGWDQVKCNKAKTDLRVAGGLIAKEIGFYVPIYVCANLASVDRADESRDVANTTMRKMFSMFIVYNRW